MTAPVIREEGAERPSGKSAAAFRTIAEVAEELDVPQHVLRFWETKFTQIKPLKRRGGRRYYRPEDVTLLRRIRALLYVEGYTIRGVQRLLREAGRNVAQILSSSGPVTGGQPSLPIPVGTPPTTVTPLEPTTLSTPVTTTLRPQTASTGTNLDHRVKSELRSILRDLQDIGALLHRGDN